VTEPPPVPTPDRARRLRSLLGGYTADAIGAALHTSSRAVYSHADLELHRRRLESSPGPLASLLTIFLLAQPLPLDEAERTLGDGAALLAESGLAEEHDGTLVGLARLVPHDDLLIASDRLDREGPDHVAGVHRPSATLAHLTVRRPVARALDLGTGNGIQAILLSRHADRVVATDVNERALAFAGFNCALNGAENVELRAGSLLEPVAGERFGCIASNPPYVISPDSLFVFRDSGLPGDAISERVTRALPEHLEPGGFATLMASWVQEGDDPRERPRQWLEGLPCDAWILHTTTDDPLSNAAVWNREAVQDAQAFGATIDRWVAYYRELGIEQLAYGILVLRGRLGEAGWVRGVGLPAVPLRPAAAHLERLFAGADAVEAGEEAVLGRRLALVPSVRLEQVVSPAQGWTIAAATLVLDEGLGFRAEVDAPTIALLRRLDRARPAREALGDTPPDAAARILAQMLTTGFLELDP
jgi:SAM-dependent methyltransferase